MKGYSMLLVTPSLDLDHDAIKCHTKDIPFGKLGTYPSAWDTSVYSKPHRQVKRYLGLLR